LPLIGPFLLRKSGSEAPPPLPPIPDLPLITPAPGQTQEIIPAAHVEIGAPALKQGPQTAWWYGAYDVSQPYGCTAFPAEGFNRNHPECPYFHEGIDFKLPCGTSVYAGRRLSVVEIDPPGYGPPGNAAALHLHDLEDHIDRQGAHESWDIWLYHMASYDVRVGQVLERNTFLGLSGTRGYSTGCHLHFEVRPQGALYRSSVDPRFLLFAPGLFAR
jgi:murein DD-endopeptidase MepM/ murein hydrolase activator NlpD